MTMTTWLDHIPDDMKPERWPNLKEAAAKGYMGQTAILGKRAWLVVGFDGELYELEAENGERMKALNFLVSEYQSDNNRIVAASRVQGSPLGRGMKLADCNCTVDKLKHDEETGEWDVHDEKGEVVSVADLVDTLDEMDWRVDESVAEPTEKKARAVIGGDFESLVDAGYSCPECGSGNCDGEHGEAWCEDCGYVGDESEFLEYEPDATEVGLQPPYAAVYEEDNWQFESDHDDAEGVSDREDAEDGVLKCPKCGSHTVEYTVLDQKGPSTFHCLACGNLFKHQVVVNSKAATVIVTDSDGKELKEGHYYTLHGAKYKVPDVIKVTEIRDGVVYAMVEENPHPLTITSSDVESQGYSFEPLPINGTRTADFNFEGVSWAPGGMGEMPYEPGQGMRALPAPAPELISTPGGGSLWVQKDASGSVVGWSVPSADGQPGQFSTRDLEKVQAMVDAGTFGFREEPGVDEAEYVPTASTKEGLGITDTADDHDKLFSDVIKALGYKRVTLETNDKIREFVQANSPADLKNVAHASDQWREIVSSLASSYLENITDGEKDMDAPGDETLEDLGIPEEGEDYFRKAPKDASTKEARRKFTPGEQKKLIDEPGEARNRHKLRLEDSHYIDAESSVDDDSDDWLF